MNIYIAGATGRVAQALTARLAAAGHHIRAGARRPETLTATA